MVFFNASFAKHRQPGLDRREEVVGEALPSPAKSGRAERRQGEDSSRIPPLHESDCPGTGGVAIKDLGHPRPEDDHLGEKPSPPVARRRFERLDGQDRAEESPVVGKRGGKDLVAHRPERFQLTATLAPVKFRRKTRQEVWFCFHTLTQT